MPNQKVDYSAIHSEGEMNANIFKKYEETREKHLSLVTNAEMATHTGVEYSNGGKNTSKEYNWKMVNNPDSCFNHTEANNNDSINDVHTDDFGKCNVWNIIPDLSVCLEHYKRFLYT